MLAGALNGQTVSYTATDGSTKTGKVVILTKDGRDPMPDWGFLFRAMWPDQPVQLRVSNIVRYLEKIQILD